MTSRETWAGGPGPPDSAPAGGSRLANLPWRVGRRQPLIYLPGGATLPSVMAIIKSAWEIALENTKGIEGDKSTLEANRLRDEGKKLAAKALDDPAFALKDALKDYDKAKATLVREGLIQSLLANLVLPFDELALRQNKRASEAIGSAAGDSRKLTMIFGQLENFFREYLDERKRVMEAVERQYAPRLKKKEEELAKQVGQKVRINPASDPEYQNMVRSYLSQLDAKYEEVLAGAKDEIRQAFAKSAP